MEMISPSRWIDERVKAKAPNIKATLRLPEDARCDEQARRYIVSGRSWRFGDMLDCLDDVGDTPESCHRISRKR
jgi:hypothetical protein